MSTAALAWQNAFQAINGNSEGLEGLLAAAEGWQIVTQYLDNTSSEPEPAHLDVAWTLLKQLDFGYNVVEWYQNRITARLNHLRSPTKRGIEQFLIFLQQTHALFTSWLIPCQRLSWSYADQMRAVMPAQRWFKQHLEARFKPELKLYISNLLLQPVEMMDMGVLGLQAAIQDLLYSRIKEDIHAYVLGLAGDFTTSYIDQMKRWTTGSLHDAWSKILKHQKHEDGQSDAARAEWKRWPQRMYFFALQAYAELRSSEMFDIVVQYPESASALKDLAYCYSKLDIQSILIRDLKEAHEARLLHPGAATADILDIYISTIRCLRLIDEKGILLSHIANPIRMYLRARSDTIRCIVASLNDPSMTSAEGQKIIEFGQTELRQEDYDDPNWQPDPVDAGPSFKASSTKDIASTLITIFDDREVFVQELQNMLSARLLTMRNYDATAEIANLELLKLRFGEAALMPCQIMLKDMLDSRRIDNYLKDKITTPIHALIISKQFWLMSDLEDVVLPESMKENQKKYSDAYHLFKPDKRLQWVPQIGQGTISIELKDRTLHVDATTFQIAVLHTFGNQLIQNARTISSQLGMIREDQVNRALLFWESEGVLKRGLTTKASDEDDWEVREYKTM